MSMDSVDKKNYYDLYDRYISYRSIPVHKRSDLLINFTLKKKNVNQLNQ